MVARLQRTKNQMRQMSLFIFLKGTLKKVNSLSRITFAKSLDPDQARQNVEVDLDPICLTLRWYFEKKKILKRINRPTRTHEKCPVGEGGCKVGPSC